MASSIGTLYTMASGSYQHDFNLVVNSVCKDNVITVDPTNSNTEIYSTIDLDTQDDTAVLPKVTDSIASHNCVDYAYKFEF